MFASGLFYINAVALGIGLAMDAFSVSLANGLAEPRMKTGRMFGVAGVFAGFQFLMPLVGWICVHTVASLFSSFQKAIPWIALALLGFIGGKMLLEGIRNDASDAEPVAVGVAALFLQGIATAIDALSVGFTIADYAWAEALVESLIIGAVTFGICLGGLAIGKKFGTRLAGKATLFGGVILIVIGLEIFLRGVLV